MEIAYHLEDDMPNGVMVEGALSILGRPAATVAGGEGGTQANQMAEIGPSSTGPMGVDERDCKEGYIAVLLLAH